MAPRRPSQGTAPKPAPGLLGPEDGPRSTRDIVVLAGPAEPRQDARYAFFLGAQWIFWISLGVVLLLLLNLFLDMPRGTVAALSRNPHPEQFTAYMGLLAHFLVYALWALGLSILVLSWEEQITGSLIFITGVGSHLFLPWLIFGVFGRTMATAAVAEGFREAGYFLTLLGMLKLAADGFLFFRTLPERLRSHAMVGFARHAEGQEAFAASANIFSPCWQLPYCREVIRVQCPAFLAKTKCWKFGRGCYCDDSMISRIISGEHLNVRTPHQARFVDGKPPCRQCYIYLEHQAHKLRWISPLTLPVAISLTFFIWPCYVKVWQLANGALNWLWSNAAYTVGTPLGPPEMHPTTPMGQIDADAVASIAQNLFGVVMGFFILICLLRAVERAIDQRGW